MNKRCKRRRPTQKAKTSAQFGNFHQLLNVGHHGPSCKACNRRPALRPVAVKAATAAPATAREAVLLDAAWKNGMMLGACTMRWRSHGGLHGPTKSCGLCELQISCVKHPGHKPTLSLGAKLDNLLRDTVTLPSICLPSARCLTYHVAFLLSAS